MENLIFGPVTSRRFGQSLGIDLSPSKKQCNFDCLYCELKAAKPVESVQNPPSVDEIIAALQGALNKFQSIDVITITANGEPTLYPYLDELVNRLNEIKKDTKLLILSNGASILDESIQKILRKIDIVKLSLDCVSERCFKRLDRPIKGLQVKDIIEGMKSFRKSYDKTLILETLVVKDLNDKKEEFEALREVCKLIKPDRIDIGSIDRPPAYEVQGVSMQRLKELSSLLYGLPVSIAYKREYTEEKRDFSEEEILNLLDKRPQSYSDVHVSFSSNSVEKLQRLIKEKKVYEKEVAGVLFYRKEG